MKKTNLKLFVLSLLGSGMVMGCSISPSNTNSKYQGYIIYRYEGGTLSYFEWIKAGSPKLPANPKSSKNIKKKHIDERGHLIIEFNDGTIIDAGEFEVQQYPVNFYCGKGLLKKENVNIGSKIEEPSFGLLNVKGWFEDETLTKKWDFASRRITSETNLYADYVSPDINLSFQDDTLHLALEGQMTKFGETYELPEPIDYSSKYRFAGWYYSNKLVSQTGIWNIPDHANLVAKWEKKNEFDFRYFGLYPQTAVVDSSLAKRIETKGTKVYGERKAVEYIEYAGFRYRKFSYGAAYGSFDKPHYFHDGKTIAEPNKTYYMKLEPLAWKAIDIGNGETICVTKKVIYTHFCSWSLGDRTIDGKNVAPNDYEHSYYRAWMNSMKTEYNGVYDNGSGLADSDLFLNQEETASLQAHLYNQDKFFLLSKEECDKYLSKEDRVATCCDLVVGYRELEPGASTQWATRDSGTERTKTLQVNADGTYGEWLSNTYNGIRLAVKVKTK